MALKSIVTGWTVYASLLSGALAETRVCRDAQGEIQYEVSSQEGGPCCGRSDTKLMYKSQVLKETLKVNAMWSGHPETKTDSNPELRVTLENRVDLSNSGTDGYSAYSHFAENLVLSRTDGQPALPGSDAKVVKISLVCRSSHSLLPPP